MLCCSIDEGSEPKVIQKQVLDRSDYSVVVTSGQRKYGGPPPNWIDPPPTFGSEVTAICVTLFILHSYIIK